jgi:hypothetical protein
MRDSLLDDPLTALLRLLLAVRVRQVQQSYFLKGACHEKKKIIFLPRPACSRVRRSSVGSALGRPGFKVKVFLCKLSVFKQ